MCYIPSTHYSHKFEINLNKRPAKKTDKIAWSILYTGILLGFALFCIGIFDLFNGVKHQTTVLDSLPKEKYTFLFDATIYDIIFILLGLGIVIKLITSRLKYKKVIFDGNKVTIIWRPIFGKKRAYVDTLNNYVGVLYRTEFQQFGLINQNRHIIELYHDDPKKTMPLYISPSDKNIRKIWENYAKQLNKPTIFCTEMGLISRNVDDLDKTINERYVAGTIKDEFNPSEPLPAKLGFVKRKDKFIIKGKKIVWDVYNVISWLFVFFATAIFGFIAFNFVSLMQRFSAISIAITLLIIASIVVTIIFTLFRKDKLVVKKDKIVHTHKYMLFSRKHDEIYKKDIEDIEICFNPLTARDYLSIISDEKTIIFGKKLSTSDLRWVRKVLIHLIVK